MVRLAQAGMNRGGNRILGPLDWIVESGHRWVVLGPNGSGKTSMLSLAGALEHPSFGTVEVLGRWLGSVDLRALRPRIGLSSSALANQLRPHLTARDAVMSGRHAALEVWWHHYGPEEKAQAQDLLDSAGLGHLADRSLGTLSAGERQRVHLARVGMGHHELVLLDEPAAGLDLGAREALVVQMANMANDARLAAMVLVTHHLEEIPPGITHAALLADGMIVAQGPIEDALSDAAVSACFGLGLVVSRIGERFACHVH